VDSSYHVDRAALSAAVAEHDHLVFRFQTIPQRLFLDFRTSPSEGPGVFVLPPANNFKDRMATILAVRPNFPRLRRINIVPWPLRVRSLERLGVIADVRRRLGDLDGFTALKQLDATLATLDAAETAEVRRAILGEGYRTLWNAPAR